MIALDVVSTRTAFAVFSSKQLATPHAKKKRSVFIGKRQTSISLEEVFWLSLKNISTSQGTSIRRIIIDITASYNGPNLASGIRTFVVQYYLAVVANNGNAVPVSSILETW
ncbi:ribbon-helix-helix domain-containing protein [Xanthobacter sp. V13C-7B]|uniref:ribbon-helix-helix domain-containing protein n=1 Tax=Xanthobacter variabilis TaxID=3119932 RepID=UPI0037290ABA